MSRDPSPDPNGPSPPFPKGRRPGAPGVLLLLGGLWLFLSLLSSNRDASRSPGSPGDGGAPSHEDPPATGPMLDASEVCPDAGFLCSELEAGEVDELRVLRWPDGVDVIHVQVPAPSHASPARARALRNAAARGVAVWDGRPHSLRIERLPLHEDSRGRGSADIRIQWEERLEGGQLGRVRSRWTGGGGSESFQVQEFQLATSGTGRPLDEIVVETTAAHEMGHALGLRHSDDPDDLMYPRQTTEGASARDFETVEALYRLPNGGVIRAR